MIELDLGTYVIKKDGCVMGVIITEAPESLLEKYVMIADMEFGLNETGIGWLVRHCEIDGYKTTKSFVREISAG